MLVHVSGVGGGGNVLESFLSDTERISNMFNLMKTGRATRPAFGEVIKNGAGSVELWCAAWCTLDGSLGPKKTATGRIKPLAPVSEKRPTHNVFFYFRILVMEFCIGERGADGEG